MAGCGNIRFLLVSALQRQERIRRNAEKLRELELAQLAATLEETLQQRAATGRAASTSGQGRVQQRQRRACAAAAMPSRASSRLRRHSLRHAHQFLYGI